MKRHIFTSLLLMLAIPALLLGQSLTELAKEEKERRKKNKESGNEVQVITERELAGNSGRIANPTPSGAATTSSEEGRAVPSSNEADVATEPDESTIGEDEEITDTEGSQPPPVTDIPADASLETKLSLLETMKASYQQQVAAIDAEIQKNNERLAEIQDELVSTGGTGLPTAPQADRGVRNPGEIPALQQEQQELRERNQALEAQKQSVRNDIVARARRAGIPTSYLNF